MWCQVATGWQYDKIKQERNALISIHIKKKLQVWLLE